jgi:hypothetical protein
MKIEPLERPEGEDSPGQVIGLSIALQKLNRYPRSS